MVCISGPPFVLVLLTSADRIAMDRVPRKICREEADEPRHVRGCSPQLRSHDAAEDLFVDLLDLVWARNRSNPVEVEVPEFTRSEIAVPAGMSRRLLRWTLLVDSSIKARIWKVYGIKSETSSDILADSSQNHAI